MAELEDVVISPKTIRALLVARVAEARAIRRDHPVQIAMDALIELCLDENETELGFALSLLNNLRVADLEELAIGPLIEIHRKAVLKIYPV